MAYKLRLGKKAISEFEEAYLWYKDKSDLTAQKFYDGFNFRIDELIENPHRFGLVKNRPRYRKAKIKRFPYLIIYRVYQSSQRVLVLSIWHERRHPGSLLKRLRK